MDTLKCVLLLLKQASGAALKQYLSTRPLSQHPRIRYLHIHYFLRIPHTDITEGEATKDGKVIVHYDKKGKIAAIEITDITAH